MAEDQNKIFDILSVFEEGVFVELNYSDKALNFKLECRFLAEMLDPSYESFYGVFKNCDDFYFEPWDEEGLVLRAAKDIEALRPDILSIEIAHDDSIKIFSNCSESFSGGNFVIHAKDVMIYDEDFKVLDFETLSRLSENYWTGNGAENN